MVQVNDPNGVNYALLQALADEYSRFNLSKMSAVRSMIEEAMKAGSKNLDPRILMELSEVIDTTENFWLSSFSVQASGLPDNTRLTAEQKIVLLANSEQKLKKILDEYDGDGKNIRGLSALSDDIISDMEDTHQDYMTNNVIDDLLSDDDFLDDETTPAPQVKHIANAQSCAFCKLFDVEDFNIPTNARRPHDSCKCSRMIIFHNGFFDDGQGWRDDFTDSIARAYKKAEDSGEVPSRSQLLSILRSREGR